MATYTSPSPFFPTNAPAYTPTTVFPPLPSGVGAPASSSFPAPAYGHYTFPSAAIYPPNFSPGAYSSSDSPNWPPSAPTPIQGDHFRLLHHPTCLPYPQANDAAPITRIQPLTVPTFNESHGDLPRSAPPPSLPAGPPPAPNRAHHQTLASSTRPDPALLNDFKRQLKDLVPQVELARRMLLDMSRRLDEYQAQSNRSFASLRRGISKPVGRVPSSKPSTRTAPTQSVAFTPSSASTTRGEFSTPLLSNTAALAHVASKVLDEMPQRADGTKDSYFTMPADDPLEQDVPAPVFDVYDSDDCSNEFFDVFLGTPEQQKSDQSANCFREAYRNAFSEDTPERESHAYDIDTKGRTDESVHVFASPPERQSYEGEQQESGQLPKCFSKASEIVSPFQQPPMSATATDQLQFQDMSERRLLWDPGASALLHSANSQSDEEIGYVATLVPKALNFCIQAGSYVQQLRDSSCSVLITHERRKEWDPGDTNLHVLFTMAADATKSHCTGWTAVNVQQLRDTSLKVLITHESRKEWDPGDNTILSSALNRDIVVLQTSTLTTSGIFTLPFVLTVRVQFGVPTCVPQQSCFGRVLYSQQNFGIQFLWDPGILRWRTISAQHILESGSFVSTERMLPWNPWYSILLLHQILLEFSMDRVPSKCAVLNLMNLKHFCAQLLLQYHSWCTTQNIILQGLYVHIIQPVHRSAIHAYYLVHALLPPTQTASFESSNVEVGELTSRCLGFHLHQINNSTSTTPGVITSFEYAHTVGFLNGQCEYIHQRGVQVNHNAKQLLVSSKNCLHIWKVDILFTTFLPP